MKEIGYDHVKTLKNIHKNIFLSYKNIETTETVIIEENNKIIWTYTTKSDQLIINQACFLGSRIKILKDVEVKKYQLQVESPPITRKFATKNAYQLTISKEDISIEWSYDNNSILIRIKREPFIIFNTNLKKGFSKSISNNGSHRNKWKNEIYTKHF